MKERFNIIIQGTRHKIIIFLYKINLIVKWTYNNFKKIKVLVGIQPNQVFPIHTFHIERVKFFCNFFEKTYKYHPKSN